MSPFKMKGFPMKSPTKHKKFGQPHPINAESGKEESSHQPTAAAHNVKTPNKQVSAHGQESDYEREKEGDLESGNYTYELVDANGNVIKTISKEEYINYQNDPGSDKPTKTTNNPDPYGRKKGGSVTTPK
tara:strand:- start:66 stop:455 length:390 start_codon:yes stop_codon:yes gene_type:complete